MRMSLHDFSKWTCNPEKREKKQIRSCLTHAIYKLLQRICAIDSHKFLRFRMDYLICVKQKTGFGDSLEDKIHTKIRFTCICRWANVCNTSIT